MHSHICPRCGRPFEHDKFGYDPTWNAIQRITARALHRFYGACEKCIHKFMRRGGDFFRDEELGKIEVRSVHHV